jgi:hypothetical protein
MTSEIKYQIQTAADAQAAALEALDRAVRELERRGSDLAALRRARAAQGAAAALASELRHLRSFASDLGQARAL